MATVFIREKKERDFTVINNTFIKDVSLSWKAKGLMAYLLSLPDDWEIHLSEVESHALDGKATLRSAINELKEHGYLIVMQKKENGKFGEMKYIVIENPYTEKPQAEKPQAEKPQAEKPQAENRTLLNTYKQNTNSPITDYVQIIDIQKEEPQAVQENYAKKRFVKPSVEEVKAYCAEIGAEIDAEYFINYYDSNGWTVGKSRMKDWKAAVRNWKKRKQEYEKNKNTGYNSSQPNCRFATNLTSEEYRKGNNDPLNTAF